MKLQYNLDKHPKMSAGLFSFRRFIGIFFILGFAVTCSFMLFLSGLEMSEEFVREKALVTFYNIIFVSFLLTLLDFFRRKISIERPLNKILYATQKISEGDFSVRINAKRFVRPRNEFDIIIKHLNIMAKELSGTETLKTDFIADVSHELKTPLAVISNYAELMKNPALTEEDRMEYAQVLTEASGKLSDLITNILRLNKLENQQIMPDTTRFNLSEQLCQCLFGFENEIEKMGLDVETNIDEDVYIESDPHILTIIWNNLISNAVKFNIPGGKLCINLKTDENKIAVTVLDTGCGIGKETGKHIFDKFYQGDVSHSSQGNGLGLALVKRTVDIVGGEIFVESEVGRGTAFTITLNKTNDL